MDFVEAVKTCLSKYSDFNGRARRSEYWWFFVFLMAGNLLMAIVDGLFGLSIFGGLFALAMAAPTFAAGARRLHDTGRSGWWLAAPFLPVLLATGLMWLLGSPHIIWAGVIGSLVVMVLQLVWLASDTLPGANAYGPSPK